jgi:hypothetical protein
MNRTNANLPVSKADALRAKPGTLRLVAVTATLRQALREQPPAVRSP